MPLHLVLHAAEGKLKRIPRQLPELCTAQAAIQRGSLIVGVNIASEERRIVCGKRERGKRVLEGPLVDLLPPADLPELMHTRKPARMRSTRGLRPPKKRE